jgi:hypothetical protein
MGVEHRDLGIPFERPLAGEAEVEDAGERVLVASAVERLALDLLRGGVIDAADELAGLGLAGYGGAPLREPEVGEIGVVPAPSGLREQDVARLYVPVHEAFLVGGVERVRHLSHDPDRSSRLERPFAPDEVLERIAGDVAHGDEQGPVRRSRLEDGDNVWMIEARRQVRFVLDPAPEIGILGQLRRQQLERDLPTQPHLLGEVDDAHATPPQEGLDAVAGKLRPDHGIDLHQVIKNPREGPDNGFRGSDPARAQRVTQIAPARDQVQARRRQPPGKDRAPLLRDRRRAFLLADERHVANRAETSMPGSTESEGRTG